MELQPVADALWLAEGPVVSFYGFPYPTRMVVARLPGGALWLWSPVQPNPALRAEIDALGTVRWLVSPNKLHHLYLGDWRQACPDAELWGPASVARKRRDLHFDGVLEDQAPAAWQGEIDQAWFRGSPLLDEVVFFHRRSSTAIFADMTENFGAMFLHAHWSPWKRVIARVWRITEPWGYAPLELRLSFLRRRRARATLQRILAWNPKRVIMAHGEWQRGDGRAYIEHAFAWLGTD